MYQNRRVVELAFLILGQDVFLQQWTTIRTKARETLYPSLVSWGKQHYLFHHIQTCEAFQSTMIATTLFCYFAFVFCASYAFASIRKVIATKVPGPWHTKLTSLALKYHELSGSRRLWIHKLHEQYGPVVRLSPNEVSFNNVEGIKEIYQSGGSGYEKTEFYDLFTQFGHR